MGRALAVFGFAVFAIGLAACGGGSGSSAVPTTGNTGPTQTQPQSATSKIALLIPAHLRRSSVHGHYVSPGTESLVLSVTPISASSPAPSPLPTQIFTVATPSPCAALQNGDLECGFTATVIPGSDKFKLTTYSGTGGTGSALSTYTATAAIPTPNPQGTVPPLSFTLEGMPASVTFTFTNADPSGANVAAPPIGVATSEPFTASVLDAAGYTIMEQTPSPTATAVPFASSFTISLSPTGDGVTLANASTSGSSLTIKSPADLNGLTLNYDGSIHGIGSSLVSTFTLSSSLVNGTTTIHRATVTPSRRRPHAPSPTEGALMLASNIVETTILASNYGSIEADSGLTYNATTGKFGFAFPNAGGTTTYAGTFSPSIAAPNAAVTPISGADAGFSTYDSFGNVWFTNYSSTGPVDCFSPGGSATVPMSDFSALSGYNSTYPLAIAEDASHTLWFGVDASYETYALGIASISNIAANCQYGVRSATPETTDNEASPDAIAIDPSGTGAWIADNSYGNGGLYHASAPGTVTQTNPGITFSFLASQPNGGLYGIEANDGYYLTTIVNGSVTSSQALSFQSLYGGPASVSTDNTVSFPVDDDSTNSSALVNGTTQLTTLIPFLDADSSYDCSGAFDGNQTPWFACGLANGGLSAYEVVLTPTWTVLPGTSITEAVCPDGLHTTLDVVPAYGATAAFSANSNNSQLISSSPGEANNVIDLSISAPTANGTQVVVYVSDGTRTVPVTFTLNQGTYCDIPRPGHRKHRRRAVRPH
jgi:hypothetical protein